MSVKKYQISREFNEGISARILNKAVEFPKQTKHFMAGFGFAGSILKPLIFDEENKYLESLGENTMSIIEALR